MKMPKIKTAVLLVITSVAAALLLPASALAATCKDSTQAGIKKCLQDNKIVTDLQSVVNFLSAAVAIVIIGSLIVSGIQYSMGGDNSQSVKAAQQRIISSLIALGAYIFVWAFVQWLVPGGIFG